MCAHSLRGLLILPAPISPFPPSSPFLPFPPFAPRREGSAALAAAIKSGSAARPFWWPARAQAINGLLRSSNGRAHSAADLATWDLRFSPGRRGAAQRASVPKTRVFVGKPQHREGFGAFQAALRESIMSILAGAILHAGPMRSAGQHGFKDEHGAGGLGEEKRNPNPMMSMMLASWASIIGIIGAASTNT